MTAALKMKPEVEIPSWQTDVSFNPANKKDAEYAKTLFRQAKLVGRHILIEGKPVENFRQCMAGFFQIEAEGQRDESALAIHVMDKTGDRRPVWRMDDPDEVKHAAKLFDEYIKKGWKAYAIHRSDPNLKGVRVYEFDPTLEEVIFDDRSVAEKVKNFTQALVKNEVKKVVAEKKTIKEKLKKFTKSFSEIKMLPRTTPG
jgi:hypothetical protein